MRAWARFGRCIAIAATTSRTRAIAMLRAMVSMLEHVMVQKPTAQVQGGDRMDSLLPGRKRKEQETGCASAGATRLSPGLSPADLLILENYKRLAGRRLTLPGARLFSELTVGVCRWRGLRLPRKGGKPCLRCAAPRFAGMPVARPHNGRDANDGQRWSWPKRCARQSADTVSPAVGRQQLLAASGDRLDLGGHRVLSGSLEAALPTLSATNGNLESVSTPASLESATGPRLPSMRSISSASSRMMRSRRC